MLKTIVICFDRFTKEGAAEIMFLEQNPKSNTVYGGKLHSGQRLIYDAENHRLFIPLDLDHFQIASAVIPDYHYTVHEF